MLRPWLIAQQSGRFRILLCRLISLRSPRFQTQTEQRARRKAPGVCIHRDRNIDKFNHRLIVVACCLFPNNLCQQGDEQHKAETLALN